MKFNKFASFLQKLEQTGSRNEMTEILAELFNKVKAEEIDKACYLALGRLAPKYEGIEFNMAEKLMVRAISIATEKKEEEVSKFYKQLISYTQPMCNGCRNNPAHGCSIKGCVIPSCTKEHGVSFCSECDTFPCNNIDTSIYTQEVIDLWLEGNNRIKEIGIEKFLKKRKINLETLYKIK